MNILDNNEGLDGHGQLASLMKANIQPPIGETLEFALVELERGRVVFEGSPSRKVFNPIGSVHGGYAATLLDSACGCAVHSSLPAGQGYTTFELKVAYPLPAAGAATLDDRSARTLPPIVPSNIIETPRLSRTAAQRLSLPWQERHAGRILP